MLLGHWAVAVRVGVQCIKCILSTRHNIDLHGAAALDASGRPPLGDEMRGAHQLGQAFPEHGAVDGPRLVGIQAVSGALQVLLLLVNLSAACSRCLTGLFAIRLLLDRDVVRVLRSREAG